MKDYGGGGGGGGAVSSELHKNKKRVRGMEQHVEHGFI